MRRDLTPFTSLSPFEVFRDMEREIGRLFDDFSPLLVSSSEPMGSRRAEQQWKERSLVPACDVEEGEEHFLMNVELPGVPKENINIEVQENRLIVTGEKRREKRDERGFTERQIGTFRRMVTLPPSVDPDRIEANYENGMLTLVIPKAENTKPKKIEIKSGKGGLLSRFLDLKNKNGDSQKTKSETKKEINHDVKAEEKKGGNYEGFQTSQTGPVVH